MFVIFVYDKGVILPRLVPRRISEKNAVLLGFLVQAIANASIALATEVRYLSAIFAA